MNNNFNRKKPETSSNVLVFPFAYRITVLICSIIIFALMIFAVLFNYISGEEMTIEDFTLVPLLGLILSLFGIVPFICWQLWKVEIKEDGFTYRNFFGIKKNYNFEELEYWEHPKGLKWYFLKNGKKVLCIAYFIENADKLEEAYFSYKELKNIE